MNSKKAFNLITVITDIIFVLIIQFIIMLLIMVIPCMITLFKEFSGENGISRETVNALSRSDSISIVNKSVLITSVKGFAAVISMIIAPLLYEHIQKRDDNSLKVTSGEHLRGIVPDFGRFIKGSLIGLIFAGAVIAESRLVHYHTVSDTEISTALKVSSVIMIILMCFARELLFRHYIYLKASKADEMLFYVVSNILFVVIEGIAIGFSSFGNMLTIMLISILMTIWLVKNKSIYQNVGFRAVSESILFLFLKDRYAFSAVGSVLLVAVIAAEVFIILRKKGDCDEVIQEISK